MPSTELRMRGRNAFTEIIREAFFGHKIQRLLIVN